MDALLKPNQEPNLEKQRSQVLFFFATVAPLRIGSYSLTRVLLHSCDCSSSSTLTGSVWIKCVLGWIPLSQVVVQTGVWQFMPPTRQLHGSSDLHDPKTRRLDTHPHHDYCIQSSTSYRSSHPGCRCTQMASIEQYQRKSHKMFGFNNATVEAKTYLQISLVLM